MSHLDPDVMALLAMGEPVATSDEADHLAGCGECADELANLRHAAIVGRSAMDAGVIESPSEAVWGRIAGELGLRSATVIEERVDADSVSIESPTAVRTRTDEPAPATSPLTDEAPVGGAPGAVAPRRRGMRAWALAAAVVLVAGVGLGSWALSQGNNQAEVAEATLDPFPDHRDSTGAAVVEEGSDGSLFVRVQLDTDPAPDTYREVWLITGDASALISLGVLDGSSGDFAVPAGIDIREYLLVDISEEPIDGDPGHSGDSIVRGELGFS